MGRLANSRIKRVIRWLDRASAPGVSPTCSPYKIPGHHLQASELSLDADRESASDVFAAGEAVTDISKQYSSGTTRTHARCSRGEEEMTTRGNCHMLPSSLTIIVDDVFSETLLQYWPFPTQHSRAFLGRKTIMWCCW